MMHLNTVNTFVIRLNNDAAANIRFGKNNKAISLLHKASIELQFHSINQFFPPIDNDHEEVHEEQCPEGFDEGMKTFSEPITINPSEVETRRYVNLVLFYNMGIAHSNRGNYDESIAFFDKALAENSALLTLDIISSNNCLNSKQIFTLLCNIGECHSRRCRFNESLTYYNRALEIALVEYSYYSVQVSSTLNCVGVVRFHLSINKASSAGVLGLFTEALAINQAIFKVHQEHAQVRNATIMNNVGRVRFARGEYLEATEMYEQACRIRQSVFGELHLDVAATLYNRGEVQELLGNLEDAVSLYRKFLDITIFKLGEGHYDVVVVYKKLGKIYHERLEYDKATTIYMRALETVRESFGDGHSDVAFILNEIGDICYEREDFDDAMKLFQESLNLQKNYSNNDNPYFVLTLVNIARICHKQGNLDKALMFYEEVLSIQQKSSPNQLNYLAMAGTLSSIGLVMDQKEKYLAATKAFEEALVIRKKELGRNHFQVSSTLNAIALIYCKQGLWDQAISSFDDSLTIRLKQQNPDSGDIAVVLYNIAAVYLEMGETDKAIQFYEQTLYHEYNASNEKKTDVVGTLQCLAQLYQLNGDLDNALKRYEEAVEYCLKNSDNESNSQVARLYSYVGNIHIEKGDTAKAMEAYIMALRLNRIVGIDDCSVIITDGLSLYEVLKEHGEAAPAA